MSHMSQNILKFSGQSQDTGKVLHVVTAFGGAGAGCATLLCVASAPSSLVRRRRLSPNPPLFSVYPLIFTYEHVTLVEYLYLCPTWVRFSSRLRV